MINQASFATLPLQKPLLDNLDTLGYTLMTPIQQAALPHILDGRDLVAKAKTGSGKTAAFGIGLIQKTDTASAAPKALILCPTRELAEQVAGELRRLARAIPNVKILTLCGGTPLRPQAASLEHGAHILVGTPGRIQDHLEKGTLRLGKIERLVLDEADRMLDMGFYDAIRSIIDKTGKNRQTLLFSATFPESVLELKNDFLHDPAEVSIDTEHDNRAITQHFFRCDQGAKEATLLDLLDHYRPKNCIVFCNTKRTCIDLTKTLNKSRFHAIDIHGDLEQWERTEALIQFANGSCTILVATDVAARGLDIKELEAVVSYDVAFDPEVHTHRIGRTGRAGSSGLALTLTTGKDAKQLDAIEAAYGTELPFVPLERLAPDKNFEHRPPNATLHIDGGRKQKVRAGDILGALTKDAGLPGDAIGKIDILDRHAYVAIRRDLSDEAFRLLRKGRIKGRSFRVHLLE